MQSVLGKSNDRRPFCHALRRVVASGSLVLERPMGVLNFLTGTLGYTAILGALALAVAA